ncbi:MAG: hypothetical protein WCK01_03030 [Candidatus Uhrbacteria bacterium]
MNVRPMSLGSMFIFFMSLGSTCLYIALFGFFVGAELVSDGSIVRYVNGHQNYLFFVSAAVTAPLLFGMRERGYEAFNRWKEPDMRALFASTQCFIVGLTTFAATVACVVLTSGERGCSFALTLLWLWFFSRLYVAYKAHELFKFRALSDEMREAVQRNEREFST